MPKEIVYDQDRLLAVSENGGDIIYTEGFQNYLENEMNLKDKKAQERRLKFAGFPVIKKIEDFDFQKSITKKQINRLLEMDWIDRMYNLIFLGPPGLGKTHISIALGYRYAEGHCKLYKEEYHAIYICSN